MPPSDPRRSQLSTHARTRIAVVVGRSRGRAASPFFFWQGRRAAARPGAVRSRLQAAYRVMALYSYGALYMVWSYTVMVPFDLGCRQHTGLWPYIVMTPHIIPVRYSYGAVRSRLQAASPCLVGAFSLGLTLYI